MAGQGGGLKIGGILQNQGTTTHPGLPTNQIFSTGLQQQMGSNILTGTSGVTSQGFQFPPSSVQLSTGFSTAGSTPIRMPTITGSTGTQQTTAGTGITGLGTSTGITGLGTSTGITGLGTRTGLGTSTGITGLGTNTGLTGLGTNAGHTGLGTSTGLTGLGTSTGLTGLGTGLSGAGTLGLKTGTGVPGLGTTGLGTRTGITGLGTTGTSSLGIGTYTTVSGVGMGPGGGTTGMQQIGLPTTTTSHVTGLGGASQGLKKTQVLSVNEGQVLDPLAILIQSFQTYMTQQKSTSEEISKRSESFDKQFRTVQSTIDGYNQQAVSIGRQTHQLTHSIYQLKEETGKEVRIVEMAQRTRELPAGLQHENTSPDDYFQEITLEFEKRMQVYRGQLEELESYLGTFLSSTTSHSSSDVIAALQSQHQPFLLLAARLQVVHEEVLRLKDQYINLRKLIGHGSPDVFSQQKQQIRKTNTGDKGVEPLTGPSPFAASIAQATAALTAMATAGHLGQIGGLQTGLGTRISGLGGHIGGLNTGLTGTGSSLGMGTGLGMGTNLGTGTNIGMGMGTGLQSGMLNVAGGTKPFQLKPAPLGKKKN